MNHVMNQEITHKVKQIFQDHFLIDVRKPVAKANLVKDMQFNYMEFLEMILYVENEFNIELQDTDLEQIHTVGDVIECVQRYAKS